MPRYRKLTTICAAVVLSFGLAACGGGGSDPQSQAPDLTPAQNAAKAAAEAAAKAATDAATAAAAAAQAATDAAAAATAADGAATTAKADADAQEPNKSADPGSYAVARDAAKRAQTFATAAGDASTAAQTASASAGDASAAAMEASAAAASAKADADGASTLADAEAAETAAKAAQAQAEAAKASAEAAQASAEDAKANAETAEANAVIEQGKADMYAGMVASAHQDDLDEAQRKLDVAAAKAAAKVSYEAAEGDADKAEAQATEAEGLAPDTSRAKAARAAATNARASAVAAKAAHDAITDDMTKAEADAKAADAASEAGTASSGYMTAKAENDAIKTAHAINAEQQRKQAIANARWFGGAAVANAKKAAEDAQDAADAAQTAATDANNAYTAAMNGRTDATEAKKHADAANAAYMKAQAAADDAMDAYEAAKAAIDGVTDDSTTEEANSARMTADEEAGKAAASKTTAMTQQTAAEGAETKAVAAAGSYTGDSLGLLAAANAADVENAKTRAAEVKKVAASIGDAAGSNTDGDNNSTTDGGGSNVGVSATWNANTAANPDANPPTAEVPMYASVTITNVQGNDITSVIDKQQVDANDDGDYDDDGDTKANASKITGLTGFSHGFDITDGQRTAIVFTDIEQQKGAVAAVTLKKAVNIVNGAVVVSRIVLPDDATNIETASYDHDGDSSTNPLTGVSFTCTSAQQGNCSYVVEDGKLKSMSGYVMTVSAGADFVLKTAKEAVADATYLAFGVWMDEDGDTGTDGNQPELGAFHGGADAVGGDIQAVTGTATYSGKAAGVYTQGSSVDYFHADATLTADFGKKPDSGADTVNGTVKGVIDNIMAGGMATGDVIKLSGAETNGAIADAAAISDSATFSGMAHMGSGTTKNNITTYTYDGSWSGSFYNPAMNDAGEDDLTKAPGSAAGTFGVTGTKGEGDDAVTTSYVGAFGAHK